MSNPPKMPPDYVERVYAGWLGKVIGVRHGANIEGWTHDRIERTFGEIAGYLHAFKNFAADDDTNGPIFFLRALEDFGKTRDITPEEFGLTWLNYVPDGRGFFWWGGYGVSTEHTAYLNLKHGIAAPRSGSIEQNGRAVAEQIGGQIFIDVWGLIAPGRPELAAEFAEKAAGVSHDGNGKYGGMFIAACIAAAFDTEAIEEIIEKGLSVIPADCEYARMVRDIARFHREHPDNWRDCFRYVREQYGYDRYPGVCHIIPNSAVIALSLLYGGGDFSRTINICNMCGWDTDCNVGNAGTILGVRNGLAGIDASWRKPINDFLCCSSVIGALNILDLPWCASYIAGTGYRVAGQEPPAEWAPILNGQAARCHFEYPGSTHAFRLECDDPAATCTAVNTDEAACSGKRSLKIAFDFAQGGFGHRAFVKTYYGPEDFNDSRYDPSFSPLLYPGQRAECRVLLPEDETREVLARVYVKDRNENRRLYGDKTALTPGRWTTVAFDIPAMEGACIEEAGVELIPTDSHYGKPPSLVAYIDDFDFGGKPDYGVDFSRERIERWNAAREEVSQLTVLRGHWTLENGELCGGHAGETAEAYTGDPNWTDYRFEAELVPQTGGHHRISFRVQGGVRSYAAGLAEPGRIVLYKNANGWRELASAEFPWRHGAACHIAVEAVGNRFRIFADGKPLIEYADDDRPWLHGQIGFSNAGGSRTRYRRFSVREF